MIVAINKNNNKIIMAQSGDIDIVSAPLLNDCLSCGFLQSDIEIKELTQFEFDALLKNQPKTKQQLIYDIESLITNRRLRDAVLGLDNGWLAGKHEEIRIIRES